MDLIIFFNTLFGFITFVAWAISALVLYFIFLNKWIGPFSSSYGEHLLFINNKSIGYSPKFSEIRDLVRQDYMLQEQDRMLSDYLDSIKSEYRVIINPTYEL